MTRHAIAVPLSETAQRDGIPAQCIAWILGRGIVVLERRGATWRMLRPTPPAAIGRLTS